MLSPLALTVLAGIRRSDSVDWHYSAHQAPWYARHKTERMARHAFIQLAWQDDRTLHDMGAARVEVDPAVALPLHVNAAVALSQSKARWTKLSLALKINDRFNTAVRFNTCSQPQSTSGSNSIGHTTHFPGSIES